MLQKQFPVVGIEPNVPDAEKRIIINYAYSKKRVNLQKSCPLKFQGNVN